MPSKATRPEQRALNAAPWTAGKISRRFSSTAIFFALSFLVGNVLLSYIIGWQALYQIVTDPPAQHLTGLAFMIAFSLLFYGIFARFREQACTFICPYGRFQSVLLDENSIVVAYDHKRGEKRGPLQRDKNRTNAVTPAWAIAWPATNAWPSARPALTSATARRWNVSIAPPAWTPATP